MTAKRNETSTAGRQPAPQNVRILAAILIGAAALAALCLFLNPKASNSPNSPTPAAQVAKRIVVARQKVHEAAVESMNSGMQEFNRDDFKISYPKNWQTEDVNIASAQMFRAGTLGGIANLTVTASKAEEKDLDAWTKTTISNLKYVAGPDASLLSVTPIALNNSKGNQIIFEAQPEGVASRVKQQLILVAKNGTGYTIALSTPVQYYAEFEKVFQSIIASIKVSK
ncbi:MAG: PsbP-related protein [Candidatus Obscuribacterales bacterium]